MAFALDWHEIIISLLIIWAVSGYTIVHLAVLAWTTAARLARRIVAPRSEPEPAPTATPPLSLAFVIPVYNEATTIGPTLESILAQSLRPRQVIVVDDKSTDATLAALEPYKARGVMVVEQPANGGKARAIEAGLAHVTTDLVAFIDADSIVHPDYAQHIVWTFRDPEVAAAAGALESIPHTWVTASRQIEYMMSMGIDREAESRMNALFVLPGASATYRTHVLREMGFEHDTIGEDLDITFRMHKAGHKMVLNRKARVHTSDPPTLAAYAKQLRRWYTDVWLVARKHKDILGKRTFGKVEFPLIMLNSTIACVLSLVLPIWFLFTDHAHLVYLLLLHTAVDVTICFVAFAMYRRWDVWWNLVARYPTRIISRWTFLQCMVEVALRRQSMAWNKLDRRAIDDQLRATLARRVPAR